MQRKMWVSSIEEKRVYEKWVLPEIDVNVYENGDIQPYDICSKKLGYRLHGGICCDLQNDFDNVLNCVRAEFFKGFDYYYLKNALKECIEKRISTIVTGSSYSLYGFDSSMVEGSINLGIASQDLYYSVKGINSVLHKSDSVKNVVLIMGPYYFYSDLSREKNEGELARISKVYNRLYGDIHNAILLPPEKMSMPYSCLWNIEEIIDIYAASEYQRGYFTEDRPIRLQKQKTWERNCEWFELTEIERLDAGKKRAGDHNKSIKYEAALCENIGIFNDFVRNCQEKHVNVIVVVAPAAKYYREYLDRRFMEGVYKILDACDGVVHYLDLYEDSCFTDEDFNDADHFNENGRRKLTFIISNMLNSIY